MVDRLDRDVFTNTQQLRRQYVAACGRLGLRGVPHSPIVIGMRSVQEGKPSA